MAKKQPRRRVSSPGTEKRGVEGEFRSHSATEHELHRAVDRHFDEVVKGNWHQILSQSLYTLDYYYITRVAILVLNRPFSQKSTT